MSLPLNRRQLLQTAALTTAAVTMPALSAVESGRLTARLKAPTQILTAGEHVLADNNGRRDILYVPPSYNPATPAPFVLMLHGASGTGDRTLTSQRAAADAHGVITLCVSSRNGTWDAIRNDFAADLKAIDELLVQTFDRCVIDPARVAVGGMSDGGTYGISLGLINGDFFTHVVAHSPGFIIADNWHGKPKVYISHGTKDEVLPFDRCGAAIAARLEKAGYAPRFDVFEGGHTASPEIRSAAMAWMKA
ncbi:MAG: phospholipase [Pseudomonadota bacterium]